MVNDVASDMNSGTNNSIKSAARTVLSLALAMPTLEEIEAVAALSNQAAERGYFDPEDDDVLRELFSRYLKSRAALIETIEDLRPLALAELRKSNSDLPEIFIISYAASILLMRAGYLLISHFRDNRIAEKKLDEAEPRFGISRKQFTKIYKSSTSLRNIWAFMEARKYWNDNKVEFSSRFETDPDLKQILALLDRDEPWIETSASFYAANRLKYRLHSFLRRHYSGFKNVTFVLFKVSGRLVSELQLQWIHKRKRVTPVVQRKLGKLLQPGDIIVTRHDDAATNLFLPGFWPHAALYIGTEEQRNQLGLTPIVHESPELVSTLEALKDGVRFRPLSSTLAVDACVIIRPKLKADQIRESLTRAISHEGKDYDFEFDFRRSDKLVCTEVPYRAYHRCGQIDFELSERAGRLCLSAEDLLDHSLDDSFFDLIAIYGFKGNRFATDERARELLVQSYKK